MKEVWPNIISTRKREHSRKPDELYDIIESCSPGPYLELFARHARKGWAQWGNEEVEDLSYYPTRHRVAEQQMVVCDKPKRQYKTS